VENLVGYNVAKAGVIELTKTMAVELAKHHIAVNAIAPAQIDTRLTRSLPEEARRRRVDRIPMGRFGDVDEVARAALFLASDDASYVTATPSPSTAATSGRFSLSQIDGAAWEPRPGRPALSRGRDGSMSRASHAVRRAPLRVGAGGPIGARPLPQSAIRLHRRQAIRGGVPVCFPWFAAHPSDASSPRTASREPDVAGRRADA